MRPQRRVMLTRLFGEQRNQAGMPIIAVDNIRAPCVRCTPNPLHHGSVEENVRLWLHSVYRSAVDSVVKVGCHGQSLRDLTDQVNRCLAMQTFQRGNARSCGSQQRLKGPV